MDKQGFIKIVVNGSEKQIENNQSAFRLIESYQLPPKRVVVELNGEPLARDRYLKTILKDGDRLDMLASIQSLGHGLSRFHAREIPRYSEMIRFACSKLGWNEQEFRGYRCRLQFPFYGSQITMAFDPPARPATA